MMHVKNISRVSTIKIYFLDKLEFFPVACLVVVGSQL